MLYKWFYLFMVICYVFTFFDFSKRYFWLRRHNFQSLKNETPLISALRWRFCGFPRMHLFVSHLGSFCFTGAILCIFANWRTVVSPGGPLFRWHFVLLLLYFVEGKGSYVAVETHSEERPKNSPCGPCFPSCLHATYHKPFFTQKKFSVNSTETTETHRHNLN